MRLKSILPSQGDWYRVFEKIVTILFYLTAANLCVVFFVQGGYDFTVGPFHLHAYSPTKWLLLCLGLVIFKHFIDAKHKGLHLYEWIQSPLVLFLTVVLVYLLNNQTFQTGDAVPARFLPLSLIREVDFDLDEFPFLITEFRGGSFPWFLKVSNDHIVSSYPPWAGVLALPVYLVPVLQGISPRSTGDGQLMDLEKRSAVLITALSVLILFLTLRRMTTRRVAWFIAVIYAFGTSSFSTSSQALWQHGPSQLFISSALYCLVRGLKEPKFSAYAGLALGFAIICRPLNVFIALPILGYVFHMHRDQVISFLVAGAPPLFLFMAYNTFYFGSPSTTGFGGTVVSPSSLLVGKHVSWFNAPFREGIPGVLISPARGLFVYSPVFLFSIVGISLVWRERGHIFLKYLTLAPLLMILPVATVGEWWGGGCYGPRLLADITPILCLLLHPCFERFEHNAWMRYTFISLSVLSVMMHALGVFNDYNYNQKYNYDMDHTPELHWSWANSPPIQFGQQISADLRQKLLKLRRLGW